MNNFMVGNSLKFNFQQQENGSPVFQRDRPQPNTQQLNLQNLLLRSQNRHASPLGSILENLSGLTSSVSPSADVLYPTAAQPPAQPPAQPQHISVASLMGTPVNRHVDASAARFNGGPHFTGERRAAGTITPSSSPLNDVLGDLYRQDEAVRRRDPYYNFQVSDLFDLSIVLPILIPYGDVVVESPGGQNYFEFGKGHSGAQLLFGRATKTIPGSGTAADYGKKTDQSGETANCHVELKMNNKKFDVTRDTCVDVATPTTVTTSTGVSAAEANNSFSRATEMGESTHVDNGDSEKNDTVLETSVNGTDSNACTDNKENTKPCGGQHGRDASSNSPTVSSGAVSSPKYYHLYASRSDASAGAGLICDTWASFLHVRLGTVYNVPSAMVPTVCDIFLSTFDEHSCVFYVPITLDCQGVYRCQDNTLSSRDNHHSNLYETRAKLVTENDKARFRMIRRYLKKFARDVMLALCRPSTGEGFFEPRIRVELHKNCRSASFNGGIRILIREWTPLSPPMQKLVNESSLSPAGRCRATSGNTAATPTTTGAPHSPDDNSNNNNSNSSNSNENHLQTEKLDLADGTHSISAPSLHEWSARVTLGEIRLEHTRLRMVDPRWPAEMIMGRRIADASPEFEVPRHGDTRARFVFCDRIELPPVRYEFGCNLEARGRLLAILLAHLAEHPEAIHAYRNIFGVVRVLDDDVSPHTSLKLCDAPQRQVGAASSANRSDAGRSKQLSPSLNNVDSNATNRTKCDALTTRNAEDKSAPQMPSSGRAALKIEPCRYFQHGGCARGDACYYLHSADPKFECPVDVRDVRDNQHPKFF